MRRDLPLCRLSFFSSELKEIPPHFQTGPPAYLECLSCSASKEGEKDVNGFDYKFFLKLFFFFLNQTVPSTAQGGNAHQETFRQPRCTTGIDNRGCITVSHCPVSSFSL